MDNQNYLLSNKAYSELGSKYGNKMNHLIDEMLAAEFELTNKLLHFRDEMEKYGKLDSKYEKPYVKYFAKMNPHFKYFKYFVKMTHLTDETFDFELKPNKKMLHIRDEMSAAKIEINNKLLQLHDEMEKYGKSYSKYEKAYVNHVGKMNYLTDEMIDAESELNGKLLQLYGEMLNAEIEMNDKLLQLHIKLCSYSKYEKTYAEHVAKMNHLTHEMITADFELNNKLFHLRDKILAAELEINDKLLQLQGEENDNE